MIEIVTIEEFLMLFGAAGGTRAILPEFAVGAARGFDGPAGLPGAGAEFSSGAGSEGGGHPTDAGAAALADAHRVLSGLLARELLHIKDGQAVPGAFALDYFTVFKNADRLLCSWPGDRDFAPAAAYVGYTADGALRAAWLSGVAAQPGALGLRLMTLEELEEQLFEGVSPYLGPEGAFEAPPVSAPYGSEGREAPPVSAPYGREGREAQPLEAERAAAQRRSFDGYFAAAPLLLALTENAWVLDLCPVGHGDPSEHVKRRLLIKSSGIYPLVYQEGKSQWLCEGGAAAFHNYFGRLAREEESQ